MLRRANDVRQPVGDLHWAGGWGGGGMIEPRSPTAGFPLVVLGLINISQIICELVCLNHNRMKKLAVLKQVRNFIRGKVGHSLIIFSSLLAICFKEAF